MLFLADFLYHIAMNFENLKRFIQEIMDVRQANYQPVFIVTLLQSDNYTAPKARIAQALEDSNPRKERDFNTIVDEVYHDVLGEPGTHKIIEQNVRTKDFTLKLDKKLDATQEKTLVEICLSKIREYENNQSHLPENVQYFLLQVSEYGSENLIKNNYYEHVDWQERGQDRDHGAVKVGDILLVYFARRSVYFKNTLKMIYRVESVTHDNIRFNLSSWKQLKGISLDGIRNAVKKSKLGSIFNKIGEQGFNITKIAKSDFDAVLDLDGTADIVVNEEKFKIAHQLFEGFLLKESSVPFSNFDHPYMLEKEINYKREIAENTKHLRISQNWVDWKQMPGRILEEIKDVCKQRIQHNLLMPSSYGMGTGSSASLDLVPDSLKKDLEIRLSDFFTSANNPNLFPHNFDALINFLQTNKLKVDWRFLSYLTFVANPENYFPIHPTLFEKLMRFYGNDYKLRANFSWELYSNILKLSEILKSKLANYGKIDATQIQSYMWVVSKLIENMADIQYWLIRPGTSGSDWKNQRERGVIGIGFYKELGDLNQYRNGTGDVDEQKLKDNIAKYESRPGAVSKNFSQLKQFMSIKEGDRIIAYEGMKRILGVGEVKGKYSYIPNLTFFHTYPVQWYDANVRDSPRVWQGTILSVTKDEFENLTQQESVELAPPEYESYKDILQRKKQLIFYGPPGTGKTYTSNNFAKWFVSANKTTANSEDVYSMNDDEFNNHIIDEIKTFAESKNYEFVKNLDSFNLIALKSAHNEIRLAFIFSKSGKQNPEDVYLGISGKMIEFLEQVPMESRFLIIINNDVKNFVALPYEIEQKYARFVTGEESKKWDNTGKTQHAFRITIARTEAKLLTREASYAEKYYDCAQYLGSLDALGIGDYQEHTEFIRRVTFHPSYSYEEFVEGIKPKSRKDYVEYPIEAGVFKIICNDARKDPENNYVLIIDEINRGNISKILGELITLIEKDKRNSVPLLLTYSKKPFTVPDNLYIIGTMNTADRSLTLLDTAVRRRFGFCELLPDTTLLDKTIEGIHVGNLLERLNQKIRDEGLREKQIGHSYFMKGTDCIDSIEDLQFVFANEIIPLLQEYFYEDYERLQKLLGSKFVDEKMMKIREEWKTDDTLFLEALSSFVSDK